MPHLPRRRSLKTSEIITLVGVALSGIGVIVTLLYNGARAERDHRRALYARATAAIGAYYEMPFAVRRRMHESEHRSTERVRLSNRFADVQAELITCQTLIRANGDPQVAKAFDELLVTARRVAGGQTRCAWGSDPITTDEQMNMPELRERLKSLDGHVVAFGQVVEEASAYLWQWQRPYDRQVFAADRRRGVLQNDGDAGMRGSRS